MPCLNTPSGESFEPRTLLGSAEHGIESYGLLLQPEGERESERVREREREREAASAFSDSRFEFQKMTGARLEGLDVQRGADAKVERLFQKRKPKPTSRLPP